MNVRGDAVCEGSLPFPRPSAYYFQRQLPFVSVTQRGNYLCWAACVVSAVESLGNGRRLTQFVLARRFLSSCNGELGSWKIRGTRCDRALPVERMVSVWQYAGFPHAELRPTVLDIRRCVADELANGRPVHAWIDEYHGVMLYGYKRAANGEEKVLVMDPQAGFADGWRALAPHSRWSAVWTGLEYEGTDDV